MYNLRPEFNDKKEMKIFLVPVFKEILNPDGIGCKLAKSNMRKGFLIYEEIRQYLTICDGAVGHVYDFETDRFRISLYMRKILFSYLSVVC